MLFNKGAHITKGVIQCGPDKRKMTMSVIA